MIVCGCPPTSAVACIVAGLPVVPACRVRNYYIVATVLDVASISPKNLQIDCYIALD